MRGSGRVLASADASGRPIPPDLPMAAVTPLVAAGLDVFGVLDIALHDALVPEGWRSRQLLPLAQSAWVIGSGGDTLARRALSEGGTDPVDRVTSTAVESCTRALDESGHAAIALHAFERRDASGCKTEHAGRYADFVALGHEAGLGAPSRLRMLLHPVYGPWLAIRSVVLTTAKFTPTGRIQQFSPCEGCAAPCRDACPAGALATGDLSWEVCRAERLRGDSCASHCAARHACVWGRAHAHGAEVEGYFMRGSLRMAAG